MEQPRDIKQLMGIFKDKASLIKATLSTNRTVSLIHVAVIRATTHKPNTAPPNHRVSAILSLGDHSFLIQSVCVDAILTRLHKTRSPYVALKCLLIMHNIIANGFSIFKKELIRYPSHDDQNSLNLSSFRSFYNQECAEISAYVRWYASVIECYLFTSRFLGLGFFPSINKNYNYDKEYLKLDTVSVKEINSLILFVEEICKVPGSLSYQKNDVVHDLMILVGKDYRSTQHQIMRRLSELNGRVGRLSVSDSTELVNCLRRLEGCRGRLTDIFMNRMRNVDFWELVSSRKKEVLDSSRRLWDGWLAG